MLLTLLLRLGLILLVVWAAGGVIHAVVLYVDDDREFGRHNGPAAFVVGLIWPILYVHPWRK